MITEKIAGKTVEFYDSIDEINICRFHKYNKFLLLDAHIGSNLQDVNNHISRIQGFLNQEKLESAHKELDNLRQNIFMINEELSPKHLAFTALIKSVNGVEVTNISDTNLKEIQDDLNKVQVRTVDRILTALKKKLNLS